MRMYCLDVLLSPVSLFFIFFFFNDTATTEIYTLSLHDALPIYRVDAPRGIVWHAPDVVDESDRTEPSAGRPHLGRQSRQLRPPPGPRRSAGWRPVRPARRPARQPRAPRPPGAPPARDHPRPPPSPRALPDGLD